MCGDIAKHSLPRLAGNVRHLRKILKASGHPVQEQDAYLAVEDFFTWFHQDVFIYDASQIAEFLNNIRWSIYDYLRLEYQRSWYLTHDVTPDFRSYEYRMPQDITEPVARVMYWGLMNRVRAKPWMHRFVVSESFRQRL